MERFDAVVVGGGLRELGATEGNGLTAYVGELVDAGVLVGVPA